MRQVEVVVMLIGSVLGILIHLSWPAPIAYFKLLIVGLGILGTLFLYAQVKVIKLAFSSMKRNDWSLACVLRDAAKEDVLPKSEALVGVAKAMGFGFAFVFGCLIGLGVIEMLRTAG